MKKKKINIRAIIQLIFFIFFPGAFNGAFAGIKYIFTQLGASDAIRLTSLMAILLVLCVYTIIFGRFFCGYACAFGALGDAARAIYIFICKKLKKRPVKISERVGGYLSYFKYIILLIIALLCYMGQYSNTKGASPWDVFSMLHALNFKLVDYVTGGIILVAILGLMCVEERAFCRFLCPMGAVFTLLPVLPIFTLERDRENCIPNCKACTMQCPSNIGLPPTGTVATQGDCFMCGKCIGRCPKGNVHSRMKAIKGNELWFVLIRAGILAVILAFLGV